MRVLVQGDSHVQYIKHAHNKKLLGGHSFIFNRIPGASCHGLGNPHSKTQALAKFKSQIPKVIPDVLIMQMGEVDCGYVIWFWADKKSLDPKEQAIQSLDNYMSYLKYARDYTKKVIITSVTPPTLRDHILEKSDVANSRRAVTVSQIERTKLTLYYNEMLQEECNKNGFKYVELTKQLLNDGGIVDQKYLSPNNLDHHLDNNVMAPIWSQEILKVL